MTAWGRGCKAYHGRHVASATPPIRAPAFDGQAKAAPNMGPDDEPRRRPKYVHLCIASSCILFLARVSGRIVGPNSVRPGASAAGPYTRRGTGILPVMFMARMAMPRGWRIHCSGCMRQTILRGTVARTLGNPGTSRRGRRHKEQCRRHPPHEIGSARQVKPKPQPRPVWAFHPKFALRVPVQLSSFWSRPTV